MLYLYLPPKRLLRLLAGHQGAPSELVEANKEQQDEAAEMNHKKLVKPGNTRVETSSMMLNLGTRTVNLTAMIQDDNLNDCFKVLGYNKRRWYWNTCFRLFWISTLSQQPIPARALKTFNCHRYNWDIIVPNCNCSRDRRYLRPAENAPAQPLEPTLRELEKHFKQFDLGVMFSRVGMLFSKKCRCLVRLWNPVKA